MTAWKKIDDNVPRDETPVLFANFNAMCLLTGAPHVWAGRYDGHRMLECSFAATNENGTPTHWAPLPEDPPGEVDRRFAEFASAVTPDDEAR